jgi:hypothetical protein
LAAVLLADVPKPRPLTDAELAVAAKALGVEPDTIEVKQSFEVDGLGPRTCFVSPGCGGMAVVRDGKLVYSQDGDTNCRSVLTAVGFKDVNGDGRIDILVMVDQSRPQGVDHYGTILLQNSDGGIEEAGEQVDHAEFQRNKPTLKNLEKAFHPKKATAPKAATK